MDDAHATALETTIADVGAVLVQLQKFRAGTAAHAQLLREALALGDRARAEHHRGALDVAVATRLAGEADALRERARTALDAVHASPAYRDAVAAHAGGDADALRRLLPALFTGIEAVTAPADGFLAVPWLRRNRPRPPADLVAEVARRRSEGIPAEGDGDAPGTDPGLPAVGLAPDTTGGDALVLRFPAETLPGALFRLCDTGELLVHVSCLLAPFVLVVPVTLDADDVAELGVDWSPYRGALVEALEAAGETVQDG